ncbi:pH-responsive protein 2 [Coccidioides immitis H538.4]|uniref:1,3-beta-glucanosyltransferase n=1 Tax=Coccidioides immitis H538.4 TaxID=396776 RepID=A0A0J8RVE9_COCIT|nr:pH-responsive protein 2 [Coccidioides immitis H538.4]
MRLSNILASTAVVAGSLVSAELDPIVIKGSKFFYKTNGTEFFMRGVAYQEDFSSNGTTSGSDNYKDPLANVDNCKRDIPLLQELRTNTIRVYAIDPKKDHSECMKMLDDAGIYVVADLGEPKTSINRDDPKWDDELYERYTTVIDELAQYSNVLGFFAGNEVTNNKSNTEASAFVKAAMKPSTSGVTTSTLGVEIPASKNPDMMPLSNIQGLQHPRFFADGGIVYMYFQEENDYGLVKIENDKAKKLEDFKYLQKQMQKVDPDGVQMSDYKPTNTALQACPTSRVWKSNKDLPPTPNRELCNCIVKSLSCVANDKIDDEDLGDLFSTVCGLSEEACTGIATDPEKGVYGAYSMCSPREKLSFAFNSYYEEQSAKGNGQNACDFKGSAKRQSPIEPSGTCSSLIEQAGKDGKGSVTSVPNGSSSSAASPMAISPLNLNFLQLVAYLLCAAMAGAGVILL